jgi:hypothetical protein
MESNVAVNRLYNCLATEGSWNADIKLNPQVLRSLEFVVHVDVYISLAV